MAPYAGTPAFVTVGLALEERRIGEQRRGHWLQRQGDAQFPDHIRLGGEIEGHLHRAGAAHHRLAAGADALHVAVHQAVAALGHQGHLVMGPDRGCPQTDEADTDLVGHVLDLAQVLVHLVAGFVDCLDGGTGQFQLSARFKTDIRAILDQTDQLAAFFDRGPAMGVAQACEDRQHRAGAVIGDGLQRILAITELLVLGPDAPILFGFAARRQVLDQLGRVLDRPAAGLRDGHAGLSEFFARVFSGQECRVNAAVSIAQAVRRDARSRRCAPPAAASGTEAFPC